MRCPKCHYLSFDPEPRCKNCGYGMVLDDAAEELGPLDRAEPAAQSPPADDALMDLVLRIRPDTVEDDSEVSMDRSEPPSDLPMRELTSEPRPASAPRGPFDLPEAILVPPPVRTGREQRPAASVRTPATPTPARPGTPPPVTTELPLFVTQSARFEDAGEPGDNVQDSPLVKLPAEPRAPLAVRKPAPDTGGGRRVSTEPAAQARPHLPPRKLGPLHHDLLEDLQRIEKLERTTAAAGRATLAADGASPVSRLGAAAIDAALIGGVIAGVLAITLRFLDLPIAQASMLPVVPTAAFLLLVGVGYLLMFTAAGGQTIGKMITGIRVVPDGTEAGADALTVRQALYREVLTVPSVLMLGAGFVPGLVGDRLALHDRLAHTRVVRA